MQAIDRGEFETIYGPVPGPKELPPPLGTDYTFGYDLAALLCLARGADRILEFGTARGRTTLALARFCPTAAIVTLDVHPDWVPPGTYRQDLRPVESIGEAFHGTPEAERITQVINDPYDPWRLDGMEPFDFAFVDSLHTLAGVRKDTEAALRVVQPNGVIVWDDYLSGGVPAYLATLRGLTHINETRLVFAHRHDVR